MRVLLSALAVGLLVLVAVPQNAVACHKGDPGIPHGAQTNCDGDGIPTNFVLEDATGNVVGPVLTVEEAAFGTITVIASTPDQRLFLLRMSTKQLQAGDGFPPIGKVFYEAVGCPANDTAFLENRSAKPNTFHEVALLPDGIGGVEPWVGTSFENPTRGILSQHFGDGSCSDFGTSQNGPFYPGEQLTDEFGDLVEDLNVLYPPPLVIEEQ